MSETPQPRPRRALAVVAGLGPLLGLFGCEQPPNLVETTWANRARAVTSPDTPSDGMMDVVATYGPPGDRDENELEDLDGRSRLGRVEVRLDAGLYEMTHATGIEAEEVLIQGEGPHRTSLALNTDSRTSLLLEHARRVVIRDVTLVGLRGGGIRIRACRDVVIENVHVNGADMGFELQASTATVGTSVFAGCRRGIILDDSTLTLRETAFMECWEGVAGSGSLDIESCLFVAGRQGIPAHLDRRSRVVSCMFAGERQLVGWEGRPGEARANLAGLEDLGDKLGPLTNRLIRKAEEFPADLQQGLPPEFDLAGVHLALERARRRGDKDPPGKLRRFGEDQAVDHARLSRAALLARRVEEARREARIAVRYLAGSQQIPEEVGAILDLAAE